MAGEREQQKPAGGFLASIYDGVMKGGEIQAFFRQGVAELGAALKAFPDSIQIDEPGTVFNPLYSDIAADKREHGRGPGPMAPAKADLMSPGELARSNATATVHGQSVAPDKKLLPSAGEIAGDQQPHQPGPDHGQEQGKDQGRSM
jgi:hypothetical protein